MKVLVATPSYDHMMTTVYTSSLLGLLGHVAAKRLPIELHTVFLANSLVEALRNAFVSRVLDDPSFTHLLFRTGAEAA